MQRLGDRIGRLSIDRAGGRALLAVGVDCRQAYRTFGGETAQKERIIGVAAIKIIGTQLPFQRSGASRDKLQLL